RSDGHGGACLNRSHMISDRPPEHVPFLPNRDVLTRFTRWRMSLSANRYPLCRDMRYPTPRRKAFRMKIVIPNDYQDMVDQLKCFDLIRHHEVVRYRAPAASFEQLDERLADADVIVAVRERVEFSRALLERLPKLKLLALVGRNATTIDFAACTELGI